MKFSLDKTLFYLLIFTVVASAFAYKIIIKGYDVTFDEYANAMQQQ